MGQCPPKAKTKPEDTTTTLKLAVDNTTQDKDNPVDFDYLYKILVIGDQGVGKTSLILRYSDGTFPTGVGHSIGVDFKIRTIKLNGKVVKLQMWDTAGQEQFRTLSLSYYRGANGIILAYAINDLESFENIDRQWRLEVDRYAGDSCAKVIVGCKTDLEEKRVVKKDQVKSLSDKLNIPFLELSSKTGTNDDIDAPFKQLATMLVDDST